MTCALPPPPSAVIAAMAVKVAIEPGPSVLPGVPMRPPTVMVLPMLLVGSMWRMVVPSATKIEVPLLLLAPSVAMAVSCEKRTLGPLGSSA